MESLGKQPSSCKANLLHLRTVLRFMQERGVSVMDHRDISMPKINRPEPTWLNMAEVQSMLQAVTNLRDKAIIAMLFSTGCRISELLNLNVEDVATDEPMVCGKGDKYRQVFIDKHARRYLNDYLTSRTDRYKPIFTTTQRSRITVQRVEQIIHDAAQMAGIDKRVTPHTFRHSTITDYILNGAPIALVQKIAGHANIQTTINTYTHLTEKDKRETFTRYHSV